MFQKVSWTYIFFYLNMFPLGDNPPLSVSVSVKLKELNILTSVMKDKLKGAGSTNMMLQSETLTLVLVTQRSKGS